MNILLKEHEWEEGHKDDDDDDDDDGSFRAVSTRDRSYTPMAERDCYFPRRSRKGSLLKMFR
jgi:hypothetical protein